MATDTQTLSPLEQIAALKAQLKELKSGVDQAMEADAREKFEPLQGQVVSAVEAIANGDNPERAAHALRWLSDNIAEYRSMARAYHKVVFGVAAVRKPKQPESDVAAAVPANSKK